MFEEALPKDGQKVLAKLEKSGLTKDFYLAGGTAVALQLNHRESLDLDFFSQKSLNTGYLVNKLAFLGKFELLKEDENTVVGSLDRVRVSFMTYPYPLLFPTINFAYTQLADLRDIALMKITAISGRGSRKDFIDLYKITNTTISLKELFTLLDEKYKQVRYNRLHLLKSLVYFIDADKEAPLKMKEEISWEEVKDYFTKEAKKLI